VSSNLEVTSSSSGTNLLLVSTDLNLMSNDCLRHQSPDLVLDLVLDPGVVWRTGWWLVIDEQQGQKHSVFPQIWVQKLLEQEMIDPNRVATGISWGGNPQEMPPSYQSIEKEQEEVVPGT
jgi:hypothetical protein